jgi:hypothetical protein
VRSTRPRSRSVGQQLTLANAALSSRCVRQPPSRGHAVYGGLDTGKEGARERERERERGWEMAREGEGERKGGRGRGRGRRGRGEREGKGGRGREREGEGGGRSEREGEGGGKGRERERFKTTTPRRTDEPPAALVTLLAQHSEACVPAAEAFRGTICRA